MENLTDTDWKELFKNPEFWCIYLYNYLQPIEEDAEFEDEQEYFEKAWENEDIISKIYGVEAPTEDKSYDFMRYDWFFNWYYIEFDE